MCYFVTNCDDIIRCAQLQIKIFSILNEIKEIYLVIFKRIFLLFYIF
jgi:hypothetical protein